MKEYVGSESMKQGEMERGGEANRSKELKKKEGIGRGNESKGRRENSLTNMCD